MTKKVMLFTYNPVPTPDYAVVEGSALRFWRMALALNLDSDVEVTIAVWHERPQRYDAYKGINITSFNADKGSLRELMSGFDTVIFTSGMGNLSSDILESVPDETQIIIDSYSPLYVEFLTKSNDATADKARLDLLYESHVAASNKCLVSADYALIANSNQKHFYRGVIGALGELGQCEDDFFIDLPAYVEQVEDSKSIKKVSHKSGDKISVLWFGGVYPWFDIDDLVTAFSDPDLRRIARLTIVGGMNPFYPKDDTRHNGKFIEAVKKAEKLKLKDKSIFFEDWVDYHDRIEVFNNADIAVSINNTFMENDYSFRLRIADLAGNGVPIATNGGDPLGEKLIAKGVAFRMDITSAETLAFDLKKIIDNKQAIDKAKKLIGPGGSMYDSLHIESQVGRLLSIIRSGKHPRKDRKYFPEEIVTPPSPLRSISYETVQFIPTLSLIKITIKRVIKATRAKMGKILGR